MLCACNGNNKDDRQIETADRLFIEQKALMSRYADSIKNAPSRDSAYAILDRLDESIFNINKKYPPGTDEYISPDLNESLIKIADEIVRNISLKDMRQHKDSTHDTIPADRHTGPDNN